MIYAFLATLLISGSSQDTSPHSAAMLVSSSSFVQPGVPFWLGLRMTMDKGWHSYWQFPGDSGQATSIDYKLPPDWKIGELKWPIPKIHPQDGFTTFIYEDEVILMALVTPPKTAKVGTTITISANATWLICEESCVPAREKVSINLPIAAQAKPSVTWAPRMAAVQKQWPQAPAAWQFSAFQDGKDIVLKGLSKGAFNPPKQLSFMPKDGDTIKLMPSYSVKAEPNGFIIRMPISEYASTKPTRLSGVLMGTGNAPGFELDLKISNLSNEGELQ
ncbi:MAG: hypothetical protein KF784_06170 [Fimbriimonadaceae bacterium]|nr:hypothetical protein [Fimbriimonadaceae bacterium]